MARRRRLAFTGCLAYALVRVLASVLAYLPLLPASRIGRMLGALFHALDRRHRERVRQQTGAALGGSLNPHLLARLPARMYRHFGDMFAEFVRIPRLTQDNLSRFVDWNGADAVLESLSAEGRGVILATGHAGNWEVGGAALALRGLGEAAIARPLDNPLFDRYVNRYREASGQRVLDKFGALRHVLRVLRRGGGVAMLVDQDAGSRGVFVPFFGQPASTLTTPADLAIRTGAPILTAVLHRDGRPMRFVARYGRVLRSDPDADPGAERLRLTRCVNEDLENLILQAPEQWLWLHRRWKTRPPGDAER